ncbi:hypothetical protein FOCG_01032 [Fusarium oxysporum f. sp. radicis-lycopersici 26381]|uniref:Uncharacterized protein n=1 Tax=Fusarium oxysporum Fo47 TaxID=660027 RepID=W9KV49_FUSOX|nr:hypothetical protein FOZG_05532 [Fusarium oxysporum Fo47]EXL62330.1 hypothetical protein FOCG_01032 [Fusarium oxysporum f. sp. radicis-lycopersici 26381]KAJ0136369.1 Transcriptional regulatory protein UME6 [Fusarium oxysporum f. sp. albedinis]
MAKISVYSHSKLTVNALPEEEIEVGGGGGPKQFRLELELVGARTLTIQGPFEGLQDRQEHTTEHQPWQ